ncbi:MAG: DNA mismatch repair endonuclease MutH [Thiohalomonadaceae bacterium]
MPHITPPRDETELLARAHRLAGRTLGDIAAELRVTVPADLRRHKGWVGQLIEQALGATASSLAVPDFAAIGVELKTLPVDSRGLPRESTYVCTVPLETAGEDWEHSWLRRKLARVLWLPVQADKEIPLAVRRVGSALLWSPSAEEEALLRRDWEELTECLLRGELEQLSARHGEILHIRPKAANSRALRHAVGADGERILTNPRGYYLRATFTAAILRRHFVLPG